MLLEYQDTSQVLDSVEYSWKFQDNLGSHGITSAENISSGISGDYPDRSGKSRRSETVVSGKTGNADGGALVLGFLGGRGYGRSRGRGNSRPDSEERSLIIQGAEPGYVYQILMENSQGYVKFGFLTE